MAVVVCLYSKRLSTDFEGVFLALCVCPHDTDSEGTASGPALVRALVGTPPPVWRISKLTSSKRGYCRLLNTYVLLELAPLKGTVLVYARKLSLRRVLSSHFLTINT